MANALYPRQVAPEIKEALEYSPVVLIQGPRQCGKTTLARMVGMPAGYTYKSFDDDNTRNFAETDPVGFMDGLPERVILDEAQKVPHLFSAIKLSVDDNRTPGRFILTGSVSILHVRRITDSLAGRMRIVNLHPLSQSEVLRTGATFIDKLFSGGFQRHWQGKSIEQQVAKRIVAGGYPAALRLSNRRRAAWYRDYIAALVQRDVPDIAEIRSPAILSRLLTVAASQTARLLSINKLTASFQSGRQTIRNYLSVLEKMFLLERVPAWHSNQMKRLIKMPKLHIGDTGIACALMDLDESALGDDRPLFGHALETYVFQELRRQASGLDDLHRFFHYREKDGAEVDIVIQRGAGRLAGVSVKASATIKKSDYYGLHRLKRAAGKRFAGGVVVYNGKTSGKMDDDMYAVPLRFLWNGK